MKKIKKIVFVLTLLLSLFSSCRAISQTNNPFLGTWKYVNGNEVFYVTFYYESDYVGGRYRKVLVNSNGTEIQELYRSNKFFTGTNEEWPSCIRIDYDSINNKIGGTIYDNTIDFSNYNPNRSFKSGILRIKMLPSCTGCPVTAEWKVTKEQGIGIEGEPDYNIPTNIIITKVN